MTFDLIIAGVGGQGSLFASKVVAQAAFKEGISVRVAETYGVAQRGGAVFSQIRLGYDVCGPLIPKKECPLILGLEPIEALRRATEYLAPGGSVVLNTRVNAPLETKMGREPSLELPAIRDELERLQPGRIQEVDALSVAMEAGGAATMNVVMLGALLRVDDFPLSYDAMAKAIGTIGKPTYLRNNLLSLSKGAGR
jgi:indolepyruvate ferredoxin oxidoreductase beta subunit